MLRRLFNKCLLRPEDIQPLDDAFEVAGAFNPGAVKTDDGVVLFVRVAERAREAREGFTASPRLNYETGKIEIDWLANDELVFPDPRVVQYKSTGMTRLTFVSHLRVFFSKDGRNIDSGRVCFLPESEFEEYGVEDPRITRIGDEYYITYVSVSRHGAATSLAVTKDFVDFERKGIIFCSENKDVVLFPEKINGQYYAFHRPNPAVHYTPPAMWLAKSNDLLGWGQHEPFRCGSGTWETGRIGAGLPPFKVDGGWLEIYHGNKKGEDENDVGVYSAGALLLDADDPGKILKRSSEAMMVPEADFEREGFVPDVIFPTGFADCGDTILVYYGAADACTGVVEFSKDEMLGSLE